MTDSQPAEQNTNRRLLLDDALLIVIMGVLAACGLIYQYLLAHYAGRILGSVESAIFTMIGLMIVAMGAGAFCARYVSSPYAGFAWLEVAIALVGATSILVISTLIAAVNVFPQLLKETFLMPADVLPSGGFILQLNNLLHYLPYAAGVLLGFFIGMEIPLIASVRQSLHKHYLHHNIGTLYGADYVGAGVGAALWVGFMLHIDINLAAILTASVNILAGFIFLQRYWHKIPNRLFLLFSHIAVTLIIALLFNVGGPWVERMGQLLYQDQVIYNQSTRYQQLTLTERYVKGLQEPVHNFYINGRLQFSSNDEVIYHSMLTVPAMMASARHDKVLIIGGGDGLALRDVLKWQPKQVTLVDLDKQLVELFSGAANSSDKTQVIGELLQDLNQGAFNDSRVDVIYGDAFIEVEKLLAAQRFYDVILVDLPDPGHPDLNKLYTAYFYNQVRQLLVGDGAMVVQSTSPYHARKAFVSIGKTLRASGFANVEQYHANVPSFGEWGWSIAIKQGQKASQRIKEYAGPAVETWANKPFILSSFVFPDSVYHDVDAININALGSHQLYHYHHDSWQYAEGLFETSLTQQ